MVYLIIFHQFLHFLRKGISDILKDSNLCYFIKHWNSYRIEASMQKTKTKQFTSDIYRQKVCLTFPCKLQVGKNNTVTLDLFQTFFFGFVIIEMFIFLKVYLQSSDTNFSADITNPKWSRFQVLLSQKKNVLNVWFVRQQPIFLQSLWQMMMSFWKLFHI